MEKASIQNILIIKLSSLGDIIHTLPVLPALKNLYPKAKINFLVNQKYKDILTGNPYIHEILSFDREIIRHKWRDFFKSLISMGKLMTHLRKKRFDLVIDLQGLLRSGLIAWYSHGKKIIGFENAREGSRFFYHQHIPVHSINIHAIDRYLLIPKSMGWKGTPEFNIAINRVDEDFVSSFLRAEKVKPGLKIIGIHPVARWRTKQWSGDKFARLGDLIHQTEKCQIIFLGSKEEIVQIENIVRQMRNVPVIATGKFTLLQLAAFFKKSELLITNDSGPMHLAAAVRVPVLALFGATDFNRTGPYGPQHQVIHKNVSCSPCLKRVCLNKNYTMECMETITAEEVFQKFKEMVKI